MLHEFHAAVLRPSLLAVVRGDRSVGPIAEGRETLIRLDDRGFLSVALSTGRNAWAWRRRIPNGISLARIGGALLLLTAALVRNQRYFQWLLVACMLSDILDGWIARTFNWTSRLGAILDSTGDVLVQFVAIGGLWIFHKETIFAHRVPVVIVVSLYLAELVIAVFRYGRISSFHTFLVRVAASALGIFVLSLFFWRYLDWIFYPAIGLGVLAYSEELLILMLLAEWTPDVGGLYRAWMIAKRREWTEPLT